MNTSPWCFGNTMTTDFRSEVDLRRSFSSSLNSTNCFSRMAVAWSSAPWFSCRALMAVSSSILVVKS